MNLLKRCENGEERNSKMMRKGCEKNLFDEQSLVLFENKNKGATCQKRKVEGKKKRDKGRKINLN